MRDEQSDACCCPKCGATLAAHYDRRLETLGPFDHTLVRDKWNDVLPLPKAPPLANIEIGIHDALEHLRFVVG